MAGGVSAGKCWCFAWEVQLLPAMKLNKLSWGPVLRMLWEFETS